jgi:NhaP-type Na+/H+ or K+/H+ antiporter
VPLAAVGVLPLLLGMLGGVLKERRPVSEPFIALLAGVLIGPMVLGLLDLAELGNETVILEQVTLVTPGVAFVACPCVCPS